MSKSIKLTLMSAVKKFSFKDRGLLFSFISVFAGIVFGAIVCCTVDYNIKNEILSLFISFYTEFSDKTKAEIISGIILNGLFYFAVMFIWGGNIFGKELSLLTTTLKSSGIGALIAFLYSQYGLKGFEYVLLVFAPGKFIFILGMLYMTRCCYDTSEKFRRGIREQREVKAVMQLYFAKSIMSLIMFLFSWLMDFLCITVFSGLFNFV